VLVWEFSRGGMKILYFLTDDTMQHKPEKALKTTIDAGFGKHNNDLIYGLPGMSSSDWAVNLDKTFSFNIRHLSAYHLTIEPGTILGKMKEKGLLAEIDEDESANHLIS